jgi:hypothetical protein
MVGVYYALLSRGSREVGFNAVRAAAAWIDGPPALLESTDALSIRRSDGGELMMRKMDIEPRDSVARYTGALLFRFDLDHPESAALAWEVLIAVVQEGCSYDVWNAAYPAQKIAKCAELRPLTLSDAHGYVMRPSEFARLAERIAE